jgi:hypothetical protein
MGEDARRQNQWRHDEHGFVRRDEITTQKVCMPAGTNWHDGGLARV